MMASLNMHVHERKVKTWGEPNQITTWTNIVQNGLTILSMIFKCDTDISALSLKGKRKQRIEAAEAQWSSVV